MLSAGTSADAETPLSADLLEWADVIFAMEGIHRRKLKQRFPRITNKKRIIVLGVRDQYRYMAPELVKVLEAKVFQYLKC